MKEGQASSKPEVSREAFNAWKEKGEYGIVMSGTGTGKSYLGVLAIKDQPRGAKGLIAVDSTKLRDETWPENLRKHRVFRNIPIVCYQTLYKWENEHFDYVIADEFDVAMTKEYHKFFVNNNIDKLLCLTATLEKTRGDFAGNIAPIVYRFSTEKAQDKGVINQTRIFLHRFPVWKTRETVQTKNGSMQTEERRLRWLDNEIRKLNGLLYAISQGQSSANYKQAEFKRNMFSRWRTELLIQLDSAMDYALALKQKLLEDKNNKILIFSKRTAVADKLGPAYHSNSGEEPFDNFIKDGSQVLSVCKKINRGYNVQVNHVIAHSYDGSETNFVQGLRGRATRLAPAETADIHMLIPTYNDGSKTRAAKWVDKMIKNVSDEKIEETSPADFDLEIPGIPEKKKG